eukprot:COSAG01_NODE_4714_length_4796_cov_6.907813_3_plen_304_part_00
MLARPQCVVTDCGDGGLTVKSLERRPLCALTCDPDATPPPGRSICQPGATCERVPNASFSPAGLCTFPPDPTIPPYHPGRPASGQLPYPGVAQMHGWTWGSYWGATGNDSCPAIPYPRFTCVSNGSQPSSRAVPFCVDARDAGPFFPFPTIYGDDPTCGGHCTPLPPGQKMPMPPHCHPPTPTPPPPPPPPPPPQPPPPLPPPPPAPAPPLSTNPCIRVGHALPVDHYIDVEIKQDPNITHTWSNFAFGTFSNWVSSFKPGSGTVTIYASDGGGRGPKLFSTHIPLTPVSALDACVGQLNRVA